MNRPRNSLSTPVSEVPANFQDSPFLLQNVRSANSRSYLEQLIALPRAQLETEPERLTQITTELKEKLVDIATEEYRSFLYAASGLKEVEQYLQQTDEQIRTLRTVSLPSVAAASDEFRARLGSWSAERRAVRCVINELPRINELLELPRRLDLSVRQADFDEALRLQSLVWRLGSEYGDVPIVQTVQAKAEVSKKLMLDRLKTQLSEKIRLSDCVRILGCLRRMQVYSESEVRQLFLSCRNEAFDRTFKEHLPSSGAQPSDVVFRLRRVMDIYKEFLFDTITYFAAAFSDVDPQSCLVSWVQLRLTDLLDSLRVDLTLVQDGAAMLSLLQQAMFFGQSLGRLGIDFRCLVAPIFVNSILNHFRKQLERAMQEFVETVPSIQLQNRHGARIHLAEDVASDAVEGQVEAPPDDAVKMLSPPAELLNWPCLAVLGNAYVVAFARLAPCAPEEAFPAVSREVGRSLGTLVNEVTKLFAANCKRWSRDEEDAFCTAFCSSIEVLLMFANECVHAVYPAVNYSDVKESVGVDRLINNLRAGVKTTLVQ